jgi:isoquinoline 1-oxidoreductase
MIKHTPANEMLESECYDLDDEQRPASQVSRRGFLQLLGAGLLITVTDGVSFGQRAGMVSRPSGTLGARFHIGQDGRITVMTGKVEVGQGSRAQLTQAAAEELRVPVRQIQLVMGDTALVPDDGVTAGSRTTPSTVPVVRKAAAAARELLTDMVCQRWKVDRSEVKVREGAVAHPATGRTMSYADLARAEDIAKAFEKNIPPDVQVTPVSEWQVLGTSVPRPNRRDLVTGAHRFPSDIVRPNMLYGKILRPPSYGATLTEVDLAEAKSMDGVVVMREGDFVGCAAPTSFRAAQALRAIAKTASWKTAPHPSSKELFSYLKEHAQPAGGGRRGSRGETSGSVKDEGERTGKVLRAVYEVPYIQHVPMEPRAAVAEWNDGKVTVWTGSQAPFGVHSQLAQAFGIDSAKVRVIMPDMGGGFGGKHTGEVAVEAARLANAAGRPVSLRWTREEEFVWAYFRPAAVIEIQGELDGNGSLVSWDFTNINSGGAAIASPYEIPSKRTQFVGSDPPLRQGSYRCLAATANNFARESFMDELAAAAGADPLAFRLAHIKDPRLRAVLETAAKRFGFSEHKEKSSPDVGVGLACGTEKGSYVAACVEVRLDRKGGRIDVRRVCEVFECGAIQNPANLRSQVEGCIVMGLGGALTEEIQFEKGKVLNATFAKYPVPRFADVPELDIHLLNRPDLSSAGGGETPIIAIAPAIGNAVFDATGIRIRSMPIRGAAIKQA